MEDTGVKYPDIEVKLVGQDGNAFNVMGLVKMGLQRGGVPKEEQSKFVAECMSGDYNHLLATCMKWVTIV